MVGKKLLIIEDDIDLREGLHFSFEGDGYEVFDVGTGREGQQEIKKGSYDLVLLDCNLPDGTGFDLCRKVRRFSMIPIIMLTARDTEMDEIRALELGVNDYLSKPFSLGVLKARMKRILNEKAETANLCSGNIVIDKSTCKVYKNEEEITLSKLEYRLLIVGQRIEGDANDKLFFRPLKNRPRSLGANGRLTAIIRHIIGEY